MSHAQHLLKQDAVAWAVRTADPDFEDWEAFSAWLGGDPARNAAYDRAMAAADEATAALVAVAAAPVEPPAGRRDRGPHRMRRHRPSHPRRRLAWTASGLAAAAGAAGLLLLRPAVEAPSTFAVEVPAGRARHIRLHDGTRIEMAGGTRLTLDRARPRYAALERGRASFAVRHDAAVPFLVNAAGHEIVDLGTAFDVVVGSDRVQVAVSEGRVAVDPDRSALRLAPGEQATLESGARPRVERVPVEAVGRWRRDRMSYRDAPLGVVVADIAAAVGRPIALDPALAARRFTGTVVPATLVDRPAELSALLGVRVRGDADGWEVLAR